MPLQGMSREVQPEQPKLRVRQHELEKGMASAARVMPRVVGQRVAAQEASRLARLRAPYRHLRSLGEACDHVAIGRFL